MCKRFVVCHILFCFTITFTQCLYAQCAYNTPLHLTTHDGLASNRIKDVIQDHQGFIWFGTAEGFSRYDGYHFKNYNLGPLSTYSFVGQSILSIAKDAQGKLWIGGFNQGLYSFDPVTECFRHIPIKNITQSKEGCLLKIHIDKEGFVWVITEHLILKRYDPMTKTLKSFGKKQEFLYVSEVEEDASGRYLYLNIRKRELRIFDKKQGKFIAHPQEAHFTCPKEYPVQTIIRDAQNKLWLYRSNDKCIQQVEIATGTSKVFKEPCGFFKENADSGQLSRFRNFIFQDHQGIIWKTNPYGLSAFDPLQERFIKYYPIHKGQQDILYRMNAILVDQAGLLWLATEEGAYMLNIESNPFQLFEFNGLVETVYEDPQGNVWMGGHYKLVVFPVGSSTSINLTKYYERHFPYSQEYYAKVLKNRGRPVKIQEDPQGRGHILWVSITQLGLLEFNKQTLGTSLYKPKDSTNQVIDIYDILPDKKNILWLACNNGLQKFNTQNHTFQWYKHDPDNPLSIPEGIVEKVYRDRQGTLWICISENGIASFDEVTGKFTHYKHNPHHEGSLSNNNVNDLYEDQQGNFWVASSGGLNLFDRKRQTFEHYTVDDGLPNNTILAIQEDQMGNLWIGTRKGLSKFDLIHKTFINYDEQDGMCIFNAELFPKASYKNKGGKMFFGGKSGVIAFDPKKLGRPKNIPPVAITSFKKFNKEIPLHQVLSSKRVLELSYNDVTISFEVAALNYYNSYKNQYVYKLEGVHKDWIKLGNHREITFPTLNPGNYTLRIKACDNHGIWNEKGIALPIQVTPPFWATIWFKLIIIVFSFIMIITFYTLRIRFIQKQKQKLERQVAQRTEELKAANRTKDRFFAIIAHDLRGPLSSFQEISHLIRRFLKKNQPEKIHELGEWIDQSANRLNSLLNNLLNWAMVQEKAIVAHPKSIHVKQLINECTAQYGGSLHMYQIHLEVNIPDNLQIWADYNSTTSIVQNLLSNAIKFTPEQGRIAINAYCDNGEVIISIKDSGVGMKASSMEQLFSITEKKSRNGLRGEEGTGLGLVLCNEFAKLNNAALDVESVVNKGTTFYLKFSDKMSVNKNTRVAADNISLNINNFNT